MSVTLLVLAVLAVLVAIEGAVRLWLRRFASEAQFEKYALYTDIDPQKVRLAPHPYLGYFNTPGYRKGPKSHNALGFRNDELTIEKPDGVFRVVVQGGSTVYTELVEDNKKEFCAQLERVLADDFGYRDVQVINAGVPGYTSYESLIDLALRVLDLDPDLLVVYHGTNDCHTRLCAKGAYKGDNSGYRKHWSAPPIPAWQRVAALRVASRALGLRDLVVLEQFVEQPTAEDPSADPFELLRAHPPVFYERNLESTVALASHHGVGIVLATWAHSPHLDDYASTPHYIQAFGEMNDVVKKVAQANRVPLFDFAAVMPKDRRYWGDGRHVNEEGAFLKAQLFARFLHERGLVRRAAERAA